MVSWLVCSLVAAVLYRLGGWGNEGEKYLPEWMLDTKIRDLGVPTVMVAYMALNHWFHWSLILCFGALFGSLTTYFKKKGTDAEWYNWVLVGLAFSIAMLPYAIATQHWLGFGLRAVVCTAAVTLWSQFIGRDWVEEGGRGFIIISTLPLLQI